MNNVFFIKIRSKYNSSSHCIFTIMNHQRISTFQFCSPQEPKLKRIFEILWFLFYKISVFYPDWPKSWNSWTLGHFRNILRKLHLHSTSKDIFRQKIFLNSMKGLIRTFWQSWQNGTFEPMHGIQKNFWPKDLFWSVMKMTFTKNIPNMSQDPPNPGFMYLNLENWDFLKKDSQDFKNSCQFGFLFRFRFRFWAKRPGSQVKTVPEPMISHLSPHSWEHLFFAEFGNLILSFYELQQMLALLVSCWALQYFGMYLLGIWCLGIVSKRVLILIAIVTVQS